MILKNYEMNVPGDPLPPEKWPDSLTATVRIALQSKWDALPWHQQARIRKELKDIEDDRERWEENKSYLIKNPDSGKMFDPENPTRLIDIPKDDINAASASLGLDNIDQGALNAAGMVLIGGIGLAVIMNLVNSRR